jgi:Ras-related protein Rab-7A
MFDAATPGTLASLERWWNAFCERAPVLDEDARAFPCVIVGNKMDLLEREGEVEEERVSKVEEAARAMVERLFPTSTLRPSSPPAEANIQSPPSRSPPVRSPTPLSRRALHRSHPSFSSTLSFATAASPPTPTTTGSIAIRKSSALRGSRSRSRSRSAFGSGTVGTVGTMTTTTLSIYHTPSSSLWGGSSDGGYESARDVSRTASPAPSTALDAARGPRRVASRTSTAGSDASTVMPRSRSRTLSTLDMTAEAESTSTMRSPALVFTSAKSGAGVTDVFSAVTSRVVRKWEEEDARESRRMSVWDGGAPVLKLGEDKRGRLSTRCCGS